MPPRMRMPKRMKTVGDVTGNDDSSSGKGNSDQGCAYQDFIDCGPPKFNGESGALAYLQWVMKVEMILDLSGCSASQRVEYATYTLTGWALAWWNELYRKMGKEKVARMTWDNLKALMKDEFYPVDERQRMEQELLDHRMIGTDHVTYTSRFYELSNMVPHMVTPESRRIELYLQGLDSRIREVAATVYPLTMQNVITKVGMVLDDMMEQVTTGDNTSTKGQTDRTQSSDNAGRRAKTRGVYAGSYSWCSKCNLHHPATKPCIVCFRCRKVGHIAKDCQKEVNGNTPTKAKNTAAEKRACFECGSQGHLWNACPKRSSAPSQGRENNYIWGWTYVTDADGTRQEVPILARNDDYADVGATV